MPRLVEEELAGYGLQVAKGERQVVDKGMPVFNGSGQPKMEPIWLLVFVSDGPAGRHVVKVPFNQAGRDALIEGLTGGVQVASQLPPNGLAI